MMTVMTADAVDGRGHQLLRHHLERAVAGQADHALVGIGELRADGGGQAEAHRAQSAGSDPLARAVALEILRGPHLMLSHIGRHDRSRCRTPR